MHIDMNSFFASVEQQANPFLRGKSVGVSSGIDDYNAVLAASYPAKKMGIRTGTRNYEARLLDPSIIIVPVSHNKYYDYSVKLLNIFQKFCPVVEAYSVDEAFLDFTHFETDYEKLKVIANNIKEYIKKELGDSILCSIGISTNKLLAKVGSDYQKPNGLTVIKYKDRLKYLDSMKIGDIWGFGYSVTRKLGNLGIANTSKLRYLSTTILGDLFGSYKYRILEIANGNDYSPVKNTSLTEVEYLPQSMEHAHVIGVPEKDKDEVLRLIRKLSENLGHKLRRYDLYANHIFFNCRDQKVFGINYSSPIHSTNLGIDIFHVCKNIFEKYYKFEKLNCKYIRVGVTDLVQQKNYSLFDFENKEHLKNIKITHVIDDINERFGGYRIKSADILYHNVKEGKYTVERPHFGFHG